MDNIFEYAVRRKLRFPYKGQISAEDLFDLNEKELDSIYKSLKREENKGNEESLMSQKTLVDNDTVVKIEIVKYVFTKKVAEKEAAKNAEEKRKKRQEIMDALNQSEAAALRSKTPEELRAMLEALN